jgi:hypothetical protein
MKSEKHVMRFCVCAVLACLVAISLLNMPACEKNTTAPPPYDPNGILVKVSDCKQFDRLVAEATTPDRDCVEYSYVEPDILILTHVNAAFNCCPGEISADAKIRGDTITIVERESARGCHCTCLYDLEYRIPEMPRRTYTIRIMESYIDDGDEPIEFTIDLKYSAGSFSAGRDHYPWQASGGSTSPLAYLMSYQGCISGQYPPSFEFVPSDLDCVEYQGIGGRTLVLDRFNAAFNLCAGRVRADITLSNDTIAIVERETSEPCDRECLFELRYQIRNLEPRRYTVTIAEPHVRPGEEQIAFSVDLVNAPLDFCGVYREGSAWYYPGTFNVDSVAIDKMRQSILRYVSWFDDCGDEGQCRFTGLGVNPCGGPREYIVYSTAGMGSLEMDLAGFRWAVCRYNEHDFAFNHRYHLSSPCVTPRVPSPGCIDQACTDLNGQ